MSNDISTPLTRQKNLSEGRKGWYDWKNEKENSISPKDYGQFVLNRKKRKRG